MNLTVSIAQMAVASARPEENLREAERLITEARRRSSGLICFPEMWTTGFDGSYNERALASQKKTIESIAAMAKRHSIWINGSMLAPDEDGKASNTSILFSPEGALAAVYRKAHLFDDIRREKAHMAPGKSLCVTQTPWGPVGLAICYDLRFPEVFRAYALKGARIVLLPAALPHPRSDAWKTLLRARAIEDQLFMIGVNQVGTEKFGKEGSLTYCGSSAIIGPSGETVLEAGETKEELLTATIDLARADEARNKMTVLKDRRPDLYKLGLAIGIASLVFTENAHAYLNPGTGSFVFQIVIAAILGGLLTVKIHWQKFKGFFGKIFSARRKR
jgi:predicted amidohydrolase